MTQNYKLSYQGLHKLYMKHTRRKTRTEPDRMELNPADFRGLDQRGWLKLSKIHLPRFCGAEVVPNEDVLPGSIRFYCREELLGEERLEEEGL